MNLRIRDRLAYFAMPFRWIRRGCFDWLAARVAWTLAINPDHKFECNPRKNKEDHLRDIDNAERAEFEGWHARQMLREVEIEKEMRKP